jgi:hypothetical protein
MEDKSSTPEFQPEFAATATASLDHVKMNILETLQVKEKDENLTEDRDTIKCKNEVLKNA